MPTDNVHTPTAEAVAAECTAYAGGVAEAIAEDRAPLDALAYVFRALSTECTEGQGQFAPGRTAELLAVLDVARRKVGAHSLRARQLAALRALLLRSDFIDTRNPFQD